MAEDAGCRFLFFSGKGGVGNTSMAAVTAVRSAEEGRRTLIIATDPASNLSDVFGQPIGHKITVIEGVPGLWAMEIGPGRATGEYIDHAMAPIRAVFPEQSSDRAHHPAARASLRVVGGHRHRRRGKRPDLGWGLRSGRDRRPGRGQRPAHPSRRG